MKANIIQGAIIGAFVSGIVSDGSNLEFQLFVTVIGMLLGGFLGGVFYWYKELVKK